MLRFRRPRAPVLAPSASLRLRSTFRGENSKQTDTAVLMDNVWGVQRFNTEEACQAAHTSFPTFPLVQCGGLEGGLLAPTQLLRQARTPSPAPTSTSNASKEKEKDDNNDAPSPVSISSSTTLTIGDIAIPIPDYALHPERVSWAMPGLDHTLPPLLQAVEATASSSSSSFSASSNLSPFSLPAGARTLSIPQGNMLFSLQDPQTTIYLRWMAQKEALGQDMCLVGDPGPAMRWLVLLYSYLTRREVRVVFLNRDVTESDLKQRREIRNGSLLYEDQSAVAAAKEGQLLVLEGLERVERNVLPVINNLLENREMHLDNGAVLIHPARYDALLRSLVSEKLAMSLTTAAEATRAAKKELAAMGLIRVSENFRVVGITVPVPPYEGNPLDPPLRSRFQCLYVKSPAVSTAVSSLSGGLLSPSLHASSSSFSSAAQLEPQESRLDPVRQLRVAIDAVNASTADFTGPAPSTNTNTSTSASSGAQVGRSGAVSQLNNIGNYELGMLARQAAAFPDIPIGELLVRVFPWPVIARQLPHSGNTSSSIGREEVRRRLEQYAAMLERCRIATPFLLSGPPSGGERGQQRQAASATSATVRQMGNVLREMMDTTGLGSTANFIQSAKLVGRAHGSDNTTASSTAKETATSTTTTTRIPLLVEQSCNYVTHIENVRAALTLTSSCSLKDEGDKHIIIADAVVATATHKDGKPNGGAGTYRIPIFMGSQALQSTAGVDGGGGFAVADVCPTQNAVFTTELYHVLQTMLQLHTTHHHICLLGPTGCGKTAMIREFARVLGYERATMHLYADMTNKDLFQRRTTDAVTGNTTWGNAALVDAALHGKLVVLDGVDKLPAGMLASLQQLLVDQSATLFDGTVLKPPQEYAELKQKFRRADPTTGVVLHEPTDAEMAARRIFPIHPAFRVVATARPPGSESGGGGRGFQVTQDVTTLFSVVAMPEAREETLAPVLLQVALGELAAMSVSGLRPCVNDDRNRCKTQEEGETNAMQTVRQLLQLRSELESLRVTDPKIPQFSFRQLLHLVRASVRHPASLAMDITSALLFPLMTGVTAAQVETALVRHGFDVKVVRERERGMDKASALRLITKLNPTQREESRREGHADSTRAFAVKQEVVLRLDRAYTPQELALVPFVTGFYGNPVHESIIAWLACRYAVKSNILLIGNQGVGKNKVVDAFLARVGVPRHYIQLHRDTTVGSLTISPTVEGGRVRWEDSPLVKAVQLGHCLVVDEIDKASVEVVQVLKGLIEDREMRLGDGRQIIDPALLADYGGTQGVDALDSDHYIAIHPDFRIIVLANPPGFPFHGNDFFRECGDLFAAYVMSNPDQASQLQVLRSYAPALPEALLVRLILAFQKLQEAFEQGNLTYPFSLRELIAVVKHLARFPQDGVYEALNNVFNFDARDANTLRTVRQVLHFYLDQLVSRGGMDALLPLRAGLPKPLKAEEALLTVPFPRSAESPSRAGTRTRTRTNNGFAVQLPATVVKDAAALRSALAKPTSSSSSSGEQRRRAALCWRETYAESAFAPEPTTRTTTTHARADAKQSSDAFTEWAATMQMPFIRPDADVVRHVFPITVPGAAGGISSSSSSQPSHSLLSFLISRRRSSDVASSTTAPAEQHQHKQQQLLLATVRLPPTLLEVSEATATTGLVADALGWPVGEVHFVDITPLLLTTHNNDSNNEAVKHSEETEEEALHKGVTAMEFNVSPHHALLSPPPLSWPPSLASRQQQQQRDLMQSPVLGNISDDGGVHFPAVLVRVPGVTTTTGTVDSSHSRDVLVDVLAGTTAVNVSLHLSTTAAATTTTAGGATTAKAPDTKAESSLRETKQPIFSVENAFLPVDREVLGISLESNSTSITHARPSSGLLCHSTQNTLYAWTKGQLVAVTFPSVITSVHFFTDTLAVLAFKGSEASPERKGVLKLVFSSHDIARYTAEAEFNTNSSSSNGSGGVYASFAWLPTGLPGTIVDVAPALNRKFRYRFASEEEPIATTTGESSANTEEARTVLLTPQDLVGTVWTGPALVPRIDGSSALPQRQSQLTSGRGNNDSVSAATKAAASSSQEEVAFMVAETAEVGSGLGLRVYQAPSSNTTSVKGTSVMTVDPVRHQLIEGLSHAPTVPPASLSGLSKEEQAYVLDKGLTNPVTNLVALQPQHGTTRTFAPLSARVSHLAVSSEHGLAYAFAPQTRQLSIADTDVERVQRRYADWRSLLNGSAGSIGDAAADGDTDGEGDGKKLKNFKMEYSTPRKQPSGTLKHGEVDDKEHHGGNTWAGGTGGTDTAGLGGIIGPYRLDKGNQVHQVSPEEKRKVPKHLVEEARRMGKEALKERLRSIGMQDREYEFYKGLQSRVQPAIAQLRMVLMGLKAAEGERTWLKGQTDGVWDDRKLVEGIVGEKNVFKRRVDSKESNPFQQKRKKRVLFVLDVSASMYRFEGMDGRLSKLLESTIMVMEAFAGFEEKIDYALMGHNGDSEKIPLVDFGAPPRNMKERVIVCQRMIAYAQYCWSGDNTVEAMRESVNLVTAAKGDAYFVFVISDANLRQYGITPQELTSIMQSHREVQMFCIFIATIGQQSSQLQRQLPAGHGYECMKTDMLPQVLRQIFTTVNLL